MACLRQRDVLVISQVMWNGIFLITSINKDGTTIHDSDHPPKMWISEPHWQVVDMNFWATVRKAIPLYKEHKSFTGGQVQVISPANKATLFKGSSRGGQGSLRQAFLYAVASKEGLKSEKQIKLGVKINPSSHKNVAIAVTHSKYSGKTLYPIHLFKEIVLKIVM